MFKIFFIAFLVVMYYFSSISYKPNQDNNVEYVKETSAWKFNLVDEKTVKTDHWFNFYLSAGVEPKKDEKRSGKIVVFSYVSK